MKHWSHYNDNNLIHCLCLLSSLFLLTEERDKLVDARHAPLVVPGMDQLDKLQDHFQLGRVPQLLDMVEQLHLLLSHPLLHLLHLPKLEET